MLNKELFELQNENPSINLLINQITSSQRKANQKHISFVSQTIKLNFSTWNALVHLIDAQKRFHSKIFAIVVCSKPSSAYKCIDRRVQPNFKIDEIHKMNIETQFSNINKCYWCITKNFFFFTPSVNEKRKVFRRTINGF